MRTHRHLSLLALALSIAVPGRLSADEEGAVAARYRVLPAETDRSVPMDRVTFVRYVDPSQAGLFAWRLEVYSRGEEEPQFVVRASTSRDPLSGKLDPGDSHSYRLELPGTDEHYEYRDRHSGRALLPAWEGFSRYFIPSPAPTSVRRHGAPETCRYLGHVLSLVDVCRTALPTEPDDVVVLELDPELRLCQIHGRRRKAVRPGLFSTEARGVYDFTGNGNPNRNGNGNGNGNRNVYTGWCAAI